MLQSNAKCFFLDNPGLLGIMPALDFRNMMCCMGRSPIEYVGSLDARLKLRIR